MSDEVRYYAPGAVKHHDNEMFVRAADYERVLTALEQYRALADDANEVFANALHNFQRVCGELEQARTWLRWAQQHLPENVRESWQYEQLCTAANQKDET